MKYQFVTAVHGDETIPVGALASINVSQTIANPRAFARRNRYIDCDLNSSFGQFGNKYEIKRAQELLKILDPSIPVVDFHTFTNPSPPFVIIVDLQMLPLAQKTGIRRIVYMKHNIKAGGALINHCQGISVEVGQHRDYQSFEQTLQVRAHLAQNRQFESIQLFEVYDILEKPGNYVNFDLHEEGYYPVLAGKSSYKHFGLKARLLGDK